MGNTNNFNQQTMKNNRLMLCLFISFLCFLTQCEQKEEPTPEAPSFKFKIDYNSGSPGETIEMVGYTGVREDDKIEVFINKLPAEIITPGSIVQAIIPENATSGPLEVAVNGVSLEVVPNFTVVEFPSSEVTLYAGEPTIGTAHTDATNPLNARFKEAKDLTQGADGTLYMIDSSKPDVSDGTDLIRKISPNGVVTTLAGGDRGHADGKGTNAKFDSPSDLVVDKDNNVYVADKNNHCIRKITPDGTVTTIAGQPKNGGYLDGDINTAEMRFPLGITISNDGVLYITTADKSIRKVTVGGQVTTIAGAYPDSKAGDQDGVGTSALFTRPWDLDFGPDGFLYVTDRLTIRKVDVNTGTTSTVCGREGHSLKNRVKDGTFADVSFEDCRKISVASDGMIYILSPNHHVIRRINPATQEVVSMVGNGEPGYRNGKGADAKFLTPQGIVVDRSNKVIYIADNLYHSIRKVTLQ